MNIDNRSYPVTTLIQPASPATRHASHQFKSVFPRIVLWLGIVLLLAACGSGGARVDSTQVAAEIARIAQQYTVVSNLDQARAAVDALEVANPRQYLVLQAEQAISANQDPQMTSALVKLAVDMRLNSGSIQAYAIQNGLAAIPPTAPPAPTLDFGAPTPAPAVAVAEANPTASAATDPVTNTQALTAVMPVTETGGLAASTPVATSTAAGPSVSADALINVRGGPGVEFAVVNSMAPGESAAITGKSSAGDWWQIVSGNGQAGWVLGQLVSASGDTSAVTVPADIPTPPPTATPAPIAEATEVAADPATATPASDTATATPVPSGPDFRLAEKRLWGVVENGGRMEGPSVICGEKRELHVVVLGAAGNPLNGVAVQALLGAKEIIVTGSQGKGDGRSEFVLGGGQDITVVRDVDGREVTADVASGLTTNPLDIAYEYLIAGGYCADTAACDVWVRNPNQPPPCLGHYSWTVTYRRNY
jgi:uncharacterized protein YraI